MVPDHVVPDQVVPDHVVPDQVWSAQSTLDHVVPDHVVPDHVVPDHVVPDHVVPDHVVPFQSPPDHVVPRAAIGAQIAASKGIPKMSCSPDRITPLFSRWLLPRDCSRLPTPVDPVQFCLERPLFGSEALAASDRLIAPAPSQRSSSPSTLRGVAVEVRSSLTWLGVALGYLERMSAAAPETTAAAWLVPVPLKNLAPT